MQLIKLRTFVRISVVKSEMGDTRRSTDMNKLRLNVLEVLGNMGVLK